MGSVSLCILKYEHRVVYECSQTFPVHTKTVPIVGCIPPPSQPPKVSTLLPAPGFENFRCHMMVQCHPGGSKHTAFLEYTS